MPPDPTPSDSVLTQIDHICDRFEAAWKSGNKPKVEEYLRDAPQAIRTDLETHLRKMAAELQATAPAVTLDKFVQHLTASGLLSATDISSFQDSLPPEGKPKDGETLARAFVRANKLTKYQAQAVYQGKIKGLVFGEYVVLDKLGQGGMGVVLKAQHRRMKRVVAIKMILGAALRSPDAVKRFFREVEAAAKLEHPNIVTAYDAGESDGVHYLVMQFVDGKDLSSIVKERGPLPVSQAVAYMVQAARGLDYAHKRGIIHRDIKPANILVDNEGTVKILDMGLARVAGLQEQSDDNRLTASGQVMGTCDYMAPEQAMDTHHADARADIYSLGCTLYTILSGAAVYKGETLAKILLSHQMSPIPSLCSVRTDIPPQLNVVFQKMVAKKPEDRQQTMTAVIAELETCVGKRSATSTSSGDEATVDFSQDDNLSFLRQQTSPRSMATAAKKKVDNLAEATIVHHAAAAETSKQLSQDERLHGTPRKKKTLMVAVALGLLGVSGIIAFAVVIRIRRPDGTEQVIRAPEGTQVVVGNEQDTSPRPVAGEGQGMRQVGSFVGPDGKWKLPPNAPPPAVAPFDAAKAKQHQAAWAKYLGVPVEMANSIGMKFVLVPPGEFDMGSTPEEIAWALEDAKRNNEPQAYSDRLPSESPRHRVKLTNPFYLGMYEVTQGEYEKVMGVNPSNFASKPVDVSAFHPPLTQKHQKERERDAKKVAGEDTSRHPVEMVSWKDCVDFCRQLTALAEERGSQRTYRLPTESQWEYACRAGTTTRWSSGNEEAGLVEYAWVSSLNVSAVTHPIGQKSPNPFGLFDMHGNVGELCADWYDQDYYKRLPSADPIGPSQGTHRVVRGGSHLGLCSRARCACRGNVDLAYRIDQNGFRVVCEIAPKPQPAHPIDPTFIKEVAALPAEQQVARVVTKLKELNPGYDGKESHNIEKGQVKLLTIKNATVTDLSPVRALVGLEVLDCNMTSVADLTPLKGLNLKKISFGGSQVSDLSPLKGMPLRQVVLGATQVTDLTPLMGCPLELLHASTTRVGDLSSLKGAPLDCLWCYRTQVEDLSPLMEMPLRDIRCDFDPKRDTATLRSIKTLEQINGLPASEFWKQVEAGTVPSPTTGQGKKQP